MATEMVAMERWARAFRVVITELVGIKMWAWWPWGAAGCRDWGVWLMVETGMQH